MTSQVAGSGARQEETTVAVEQPRLAWQRPSLRTLLADEAKATDAFNTDGSFTS